MTAFELSKDHEDFRAVVREFAEEQVAPHVEQWDREHRFPVELVPQMGELGLFGLVVPEEYGGAGGDFTSLCVAIEELGRVDQSIGITLSAGRRPRHQPDPQLRQRRAEAALAARPRRRPRARRVRPHRAGRRLRRGATRTKARLDGEGDDAEWVVDGAKAFITNSGSDITSVVTVTARTGTLDDGRAEISAIMIPSGTPGFTVEPAYRQARVARQRHPRADLRRRPRAGRPPARAAAARASSSSSRRWTTAVSPSRRSQSVWPRRASRRRTDVREDPARLRPGRSVSTRVCRSRSPTSRWPSRPHAC